MCDIKTYSRGVRRKHLAKILIKTCHTVTVLSSVRHHCQITLFNIAALLDTFLHVLNFAKPFKVIGLECIIRWSFYRRRKLCTLVLGHRVAVNHENHCAGNKLKLNKSMTGQDTIIYWIQHWTDQELSLPWKKTTKVIVRLTKVSISFLISSYTDQFIDTKLPELFKRTDVFDLDGCVKPLWPVIIESVYMIGRVLQMPVPDFIAVTKHLCTNIHLAVFLLACLWPLIKRNQNFAGLLNRCHEDLR